MKKGSFYIAIHRKKNILNGGVKKKYPFNVPYQDFMQEFIAPYRQQKHMSQSAESDRGRKRNS